MECGNRAATSSPSSHHTQEGERRTPAAPSTPDQTIGRCVPGTPPTAGAVARLSDTEGSERIKTIWNDM